MSLDDLVLLLQRRIDRAVRRIRLGAAPARGARRLLIVQIDGLSRSVFAQALAAGRLPFLRRLLERGHRLEPMNVGLPSSTPAFQMAAMYGVRPDIPGFHYHDKKRRTDVYFPRAGDAAYVESTQAGGRLGILDGGSSYGCVFTGGAADNLFSFAMIKRPSGAGMMCACSAFVVLTWVIVKCLVLSGAELARSALRLIADPGREVRGWKWLAIKLGISVWLRELFTLAVSRDLYRGVPAVYVNYLDYDIAAHAFGPRHRRALGALRRVDRSIHQLWRILRRVPEHSYDLYVLSDHGQLHCVPYVTLTGGLPLERRLFDEILDPTRVSEVGPAQPRGRRVARGIKALRSHRGTGLFQRFVNYLERDFPIHLTGGREVDEQDGVRMISAGPNAFIYFLSADRPLVLEEIDERFPGLAEELSRDPGVGYVLARSNDGPVVTWRGKRHRLGDGDPGPFAGREDVELVMQGIRDLMAMPSAGDLVLYGQQAVAGDVSYIAEIGAHAGASPDEMQTFLVHPGDVTPPAPLTHPIQLYAHFLRYQRGVA